MFFKTREILTELSAKSNLSQGLLTDQCKNRYLKFSSYPEHVDRERTTIGGTHFIFCNLYILKSFLFHLASSFWSSIPSKIEKLIINQFTIYYIDKFWPLIVENKNLHISLQYIRSVLRQRIHSVSRSWSLIIMG